MTSQTTTSKDQHVVFIYLGLLVFSITLISPTGNLLDVGVSFLLKNQLGASSVETSQFRLLCSLPIYFGFVFGLLRDFWNPFSMGDRGYFLIIAPLIGMCYLGIFFSELNYTTLLLQMIFVVCVFKLMLAACHALVALIAQKRAISGQLGALLLIAKNSPEILGAWLATYFIQSAFPSAMFAFVALVAIIVLALAMWKPRAAYTDLDISTGNQKRHLLADVKRLLHHRAIYPVLLMMLMFNFAPGFNTPLQYHLTNNLFAPDKTYGHFLAIFFASLLPGFFLYGFLSRKISFNKLLWFSMIIAVPQMMLLGFIDSIEAALNLAIPMGLIAGLAYGALYDLAIRSCPDGLQGSFMMLVAGVLSLSDRGSDLIGSVIFNAYPSSGLMYCALATTIVYALILPLILFIPVNIKAK